MPEPDSRAPTLEILLPYYGDDGYFRETVWSVMAQTDGHWRLTVVEDGDQGWGAGRWLEALADDRVRHLQNEHNVGLAANFQRCLDVSSQEYVTFLGCDDRLRPTYVETIRRGLATVPRVSMVQPGVQVIDQEGRPATPLADRLKARLAPHAGEGTVLSGEQFYASLMTGNWTYFPSIAWRRESLSEFGFRQDLGVALDLVALSSLVLNGASMLLMPDVVFEYRRHLGSVSSVAATNAERFDEERQVLDELAIQARDHGWPRAARAARIRITSRAHAVLFLPNAIRSRSWDAAGTYVRHAFGP